MPQHAYLNYIKRLSTKFKLNEKKVILAFDYTDEDFYGNVQGFDIHGWTGKEGISGHSKLLTCSTTSDEIPQKIPLTSMPIRLGHYKSSAISHCLSLIKNYIGGVELILFDRGFYDKDLMYELTEINYPYLIFVPKHQDKQSILYPMDKGEQIAIYNEFKVNKNQSNYLGENILIFLKQIYDPKSEKDYDWVFATNVEEILLENLVVTYKKRWGIETQFRVQDEARIKCKSKDMKIRYFLFLFEQMLQTIWICFYKDEYSFKEFLIAMAKMSRKWTKTKDA
ncbi:MAG: transposase [archaeon]